MALRSPQSLGRPRRRGRAQGLCAHQALDAMQATALPQCQHIVPDTAGRRHARQSQRPRPLLRLRSRGTDGSACRALAAFRADQRMRSDSVAWGGLLQSFTSSCSTRHGRPSSTVFVKSSRQSGGRSTERQASACAHQREQSPSFARRTSLTRDGSDPTGLMRAATSLPPRRPRLSQRPQHPPHSRTCARLAPALADDSGAAAPVQAP